MGGLTVHSNGWGTVCLRCYQGIKEGNGPISLIALYCKLDCWIYTIDMIQKCLFVTLLLDDPEVIRKPKPIPRRVGRRLESFSLKMFHVQICSYGAYQRPHSHSFNLLIEFILKRIVSIMQTEPQKVNDVLY